MSIKPKIVVVAGPTASGKTAVAVAIAKQFKGEVISADSRQIYRKLDIGTAKTTPEEMAGVPHHLIDIIDVHESYSAANFVVDATAIISALNQQNKLPVIAGGTFFYIDALLKKTSLPTVDPKPELRGHLEEFSTEMLFAELSRLDPERAQSIDQHNKRRIVRALEIVYSMGSVPPAVAVEPPFEALTLGLQLEKKDLRDRFSQRGQDWLKRGFKTEVAGLLAAGVTRDRLREIGFEYSLMLEMIDKNLSEDEFIQRFVQKNWQYAKRQLTWLKKDKSVEWYDPQNRSAILRRVENFLNSG